MSGEGVLPARSSPIAPLLEAVRARVERSRPLLPYGAALAAAFDMRPSELEATRIEPASGILVCGCRSREDGRWRVLATVRGADGTMCQVQLEAAAARALAAELREMAGLIEGDLW